VVLKPGDLTAEEAATVKKEGKAVKSNDIVPTCDPIRQIEK
jgi:hypothetical protein